ncbi:Plastocyanin-like [Macleaya cordata]|uniref:Plastocyanin-like n=1 Tax=Macleaya cordata TaxID=56857 RepID=A0A200QWR4_MACCD|nr:Plastocyanin-like [Macleaya cordata]
MVSIEEQRSLSIRFLIIVVIMLMGSSEARDFYVGGSAGWVVNPSETYEHWAERNRFQVNDNLIFKYKKGTDSVLIVSKEDYDKCNTIKPIKRMEYKGDSTSLKIHRSGSFFFISGNQGSCRKGQKLFIVVMSVRYQKSSPPPQTPALTPQPAVSPVPAHAPTAKAQAHAQAPAPIPSSSPAAASLPSKYSIALVSVPVSLFASCSLLWLL